MASAFIVPSFNPATRVSWFGAQKLFRVKSAGGAGVDANLINGGTSVLEAIVLYNKNAAARFIKFYDEAVAPAIGTDTVLFDLELPGSMTQPLAISFGVAVPFLNGLGFGLTVNQADSDATAVSADDVHGFLLWSGLK